ncbi:MULTISPECIES: head-tail joining protein [Roseomonadaceae]|uniref:Uncharacterized protein n=1 Tax=Falsiroseomonas oleicola TaxID=2801474 RepID=A0ABS6H5N0_9PROT|nr:hypothetical protein [Roseomonas oleicola]MBU8543992.1 hypothetical protein [Roseomonas oleicola]
MNDAIAAMLRDVAADPNVGVDARWTSREGGPHLDVRVVPSSPEQAFGTGTTPMMGVQVVVMLPADALPGRPEAGDLLAFSGLSYKISSISQDPRGTSFALGLKRQLSDG